MRMLTNPEIFEQQRYIAVNNALPQDYINYISNAIRFDTIQRPIETDDGIAPLTQTKYASPMTEALLIHLKPLVEKATGLNLKPTYSYYRIYKPGDYLLKHKDREACEISITINLGFKYFDVTQDYTWDIFVNGVKFKTMPGDMVIYRGIELEHWREEFQAGPGSWQLQAFLHYVDANGPHTDFIYDGRKGIGYNYNDRA